MGAAKTHASLVANYGDGRIRIFSCRWGGNSGGFAYFASSFTSDSRTSCSLRSSASLVKGLARRVTPESASPGCVKPVYPDIKTTFIVGLIGAKFAAKTRPFIPGI